MEAEVKKVMTCARPQSALGPAFPSLARPNLFSGD